MANGYIIIIQVPLISVFVLSFNYEDLNYYFDLNFDGVLEEDLY